MQQYALFVNPCHSFVIDELWELKIVISSAKLLIIAHICTSFRISHFGVKFEVSFYRNQEEKSPNGAQKCDKILIIFFV